MRSDLAIAENEPSILTNPWRFDFDPSGPKTNVGSFLNNRREGPSNIYGMPVALGDRMYVAGGGDWFWGKNEASVRCIRTTGQGDVSASNTLWSYPLGRHTMSTPAIANGLVFCADSMRTLHCIDAVTGKGVWTHELDGEVWASALVADGKVEEFDGDLDDYARWLTDYRLRNAPVSNTPVNPDKTDKKAQRQAAAALRQQLAPHKREADKLEAELGKLHEKLAKIDTSLGDSDIYEPARKNDLRDLLAEQAKLKVREAELEEAWMEALELLESMQAELEALS